MKQRIKWIIMFTVIILFVTTYWSFTFASSNEGFLFNPTVDVKDPSENKEMSIAENEAGQALSQETKMEPPIESDSSAYIHELFFHKNIDIGSSEASLLEALGTPSEEGMYEGGRYYDYGDKTYFVNPETEQVNAIAVPSELLNLDQWEEVEELFVNDRKLAGMNEKDGLWMEIYDWKNYDVMIEREDEAAAPYFVWLMEDSLFMP